MEVAVLQKKSLMNSCFPQKKWLYEFLSTNIRRNV